MLSGSAWSFSARRQFHCRPEPTGCCDEAIATRDGKLDLVAVNTVGNSASVLLGNGDGTFLSAKTFSISGLSPGDQALADVNGDGKLDLITANRTSNNVSVLRQQYTVPGSQRFTFPVGTNPYSGCCRVNGDGQSPISLPPTGIVGDAAARLERRRSFKGSHQQRRRCESAVHCDR